MKSIGHMAEMAARDVPGREQARYPSAVSGDTIGYGFIAFARIVFGVFFLGSAVLKMWQTDTMTGMLGGAGFASPLPFVYFAAACQAAAGVALISGFMVREAALGLIAYIAVVNFYLHAFWLLDGEAASIQFQLFSKNAGIMTGLLAVAGTASWAYGRGTGSNAQ